MAGAVGCARSNEVLVYSGEGAGTRSLLSAMDSLSKALKPDVVVRKIGALELLRGEWMESKMLVMPGGADLPYCRALNGRGNELIRGFVEGGGAYLGLCAGAYYACARVEFEVGNALEVVGDRELRFFDGVAQGSIVPGFCYYSEAGSAAVPLDFRDLTGTLEVVPGRLLACTTAAQTAGHGAAEVHTTRALSSSSSSWSRCVDYVNGGPAFVPREGCVPNILAWYGMPQPAVAALSVEVGAGSVVLCGSHPELPPEWLQPMEDQDALKPQVREGRISADTAAVSATNAARVAWQLKAASVARWRFWRSLIIAAGLAEILDADSHPPQAQ